MQTSNADGGEPAARLEGASKTYGRIRALDDVTFGVPRGALVGVIGPSAAGKTTAIGLLTGNVAPSSGTVRTLGADPARLPRSTRRRIGLMPQQLTLFRDLKAQENVDFFASLFGVAGSARKRRTREVLELLDMWDARAQRADRLSGGQQRRVQLACALVHEPDLIFLDEPTAGIDPLLRQHVWEELMRLRDTGRTLLVTTQYVVDSEHCDLVALISAGRLLAFAPPQELRRAALGGEVIQLEVDETWDASPLAAQPYVERVHRVGPGRYWAVVESAGRAIPGVVETVRRDGIEPISIREYRPGFDEVFAALVRRQENAARNGGQEPSAAPMAPGDDGDDQPPPMAPGGGDDDQPPSKAPR